MIGDRCKGSLIEALPRRHFLVDERRKRVLEAGTASRAARCKVVDCKNWKCIDEVFVRTATDGQYRELLRAELIALDPGRAGRTVHVSAGEWWRLAAEGEVRKVFARARAALGV